MIQTNFTTPLSTYHTAPQRKRSMRFRATSLILQVLLVWWITAPMQAQPTLLRKAVDYLPSGTRYDASIPAPEDVIGHNVGEWHITHDRLVRYMDVLAENSDRIRIKPLGTTYEGRPQIQLVITSPENHARMESIQKTHAMLLDPGASARLDLSGMPVVVQMGYSIHGNEPSGSNAALVVAYHLAAATSPEIETLLSQSVILLDPSFNPDGLQRFSTWANAHRGMTVNGDPASREFNEMWPGGRTNHYWFDLNRDWLPVQHPESRARVRAFQDFRPNVLTDHHEMGTNSTFFFQPGIPSRTNPLTPSINQELTAAIAQFHADALDAIGSLYYARESFDDYYYGKGSTYPDAQGSIGILFEQASSRGHAQESENGLLTFPETILNQVRTSLSTLRASQELRVDLLEYMRSSVKASVDRASASAVKGYIVGSSTDRSRNWHFADILDHHGIRYAPLSRDVTLAGTSFKKGMAWVIPSAQPQAILVESIFERRTTFQDSLFYDVSAWTLPYAFGIPFVELKGKENPSGYVDGWNGNGPLTGRGAGVDASGGTTLSESVYGPSSRRTVDDPSRPAGRLAAKEGSYAYLTRWDDYYAPSMLHHLLDAGVRAKVAEKPFMAVTQDGPVQFPQGTIVVSSGTQELDAATLHETMASAAKKFGGVIHGVETGLSAKGIDLGSPNMAALRNPSVAVLVGQGVTSSEAGEIWHLLDQRLGIPVSLLPSEGFSRADLARYNVLVFPSGSYGSLSDATVGRIRSWVSGGGTLIVQKGAISWAMNNGLLKAEQASTDDDEETDDAATARKTYGFLSEDRGARQIGGSIFFADLDLTHPLAYGFTEEVLPVFKNSTFLLEKGKNPYSSPLIYTESPLAAGYVHPKDLPGIAGKPAVLVGGIGSGSVIAFVDNPNFRAFWFGTNRLFLNAIYFGHTISGAAKE